MKTICVQIGNSDDKLTQNEWAHFVAEVGAILSGHARHIHFHGGSAFDAPWQNVCWVAEVDSDHEDGLIAALVESRASFNQDSVAVLIGSTQFI